MTLTPSPWVATTGQVEPVDETVVARLVSILQPGCRVAVADGAGAPIGLLPALSEAARRVGGVHLFTGWWMGPPPSVDQAAFRTITTVMGGYGLTSISEWVHYIPTRLSAVPALLHGALRPDVLVLGLGIDERGAPAFGPEVAWMPAAAEAARCVVAEVNEALPITSAHPVPALRVEAIAHVDRPPIELPRAAPDDVMRRIGRHVASHIRVGDTIQFGPGALSEATLSSLEVPVRVESGVITDMIIDLNDRRLLLGRPSCTYVAGSARLYEWSDGRQLTHRVEWTHDQTRLSRLPLVAINTAIEIDHDGQINIERARGRLIAGVGGHPDFAAAASIAPHGISIIALPSTWGGRPTLVERLSAPVSTPRSDVDVVVTERGSADLRGLDDRSRRAVLRELWD